MPPAPRYLFCHGNGRGWRNSMLHVGMVRFLPWGVGRRGEVLWHFEPCKDLDWKAQRLRQVSLSGTSTLHRLSSRFAALAYACQPQVCSSYSQAEYNTRKTIHIPLGKKRGSIHHSIYNTAKMSCQNKHTHKYCEQKNTRKWLSWESWRGMDIA